MTEELLVFALLLCEEMVPEDEYQKRLDERFMNHPENDDLLYLEWETDRERAVMYIRTHIDYSALDCERFGRILMEKIKVYYETHSDINCTACRMYSLWESLPGNIQDKEPFFALSYADDPLSWGDEEQTRNILENMVNYYKRGND